MNTISSMQAPSGRGLGNSTKRWKTQVVEPLNSKDPKTIGGFTLVGRLGKGGMGVVYLASRKSESVALKVIRDSLIDDEAEATRFSREVSTLEQISSTNVARIVHAGVEKGRAWFAAEFVNGPNLSELVNDKGPLDEDQWWELARGLLNGLADVHKTGVIHRDVKPANVIIAETGPKLIDFGIAHVSDATSVTATGLVAGSPAWFSPEQIEGLELTSATDVFSAGSVLTFAATGSSPWGGETTMTKASVFKILTSEPDLGGLPPEQRFLLEQMLSKEPTERPTAESLRENLDHIRGGKTPKLKSSSSSATRASNDATTTTKRSVLKETERGSGQTNTTSGGGSTAVTATMFSKNRTRLLVGAIAAIAILGISLLVANSSGSGKVSVAVVVDKANPAVGEFALRLSSGSIEPVVLDLAAKKAHQSVFTWTSEEPIRLSYEPPFSEDEEFVGTIMPSDLGLNGFSNGRPLFVLVSLEETSTLISFRTGADRDANEVYAIRLSRGNETQVLNQCVSERAKQIETQAAGYRNLYNAYESAKERANLGFFGDGTTSLYYTTWAFRAGQVASFMESDLQAAELGSALEPASRNYVSGIVDTHSKLVQAWNAFRSASQRENDADFASTALEIYTFEDGLRSAVSSSPNSFAKSDCSESVK